MRLISWRAGQVTLFMLAALLAMCWGAYALADYEPEAGIARAAMVVVALALILWRVLGSRRHPS